jgi:hypothetical protein
MSDPDVREGLGCSALLVVAVIVSIVASVLIGFRL